MMKLIRELYNEGIASSFEEAYFMLVDMGEIREDERIRRWCINRDMDKVLRPPKPR